MSGVEITDFDPRIKVESYFASHHIKVADVIRFAEMCEEAIAAGLDPNAAVEFRKSEPGHVIQLWAQSGGHGERRLAVEEAAS